MNKDILLVVCGSATSWIVKKVLRSRGGLSGVKAFEFKWNPRKAGVLPPKTFRTAYPDADCRTITPETVFEFLSNG